MATTKRTTPYTCQYCHSTEPKSRPQPSNNSKDKELSTTALHVSEQEATSSSTPPTKPRARRLAAIQAEELAEGQCSSGDPPPPPKAPRPSVDDAHKGSEDILAAARRVSKHVYKRLLPQLDSFVTDAQLAEEAHGAADGCCWVHSNNVSSVCVQALADLGDGADEPAPEGAAASMLWMRVQRVCRDAITEAEDALGDNRAGHGTPLPDDNIGYAWKCMWRHLHSLCVPRDAYRSAFVTEFADDLDAMRQQAAEGGSELPLDELVRLISSGTNVFSPTEVGALSRSAQL